MKLELNKQSFLALKVTLGILGVITLYQIVPYFTKMLSVLVDLYKLIDTSYEFKFLLICLSLWITIQVINCIVNIIYKLQNLIKLKKNDFA